MSVNKVPYESLALAVDKLYPPHYQLKDGETEEQHCEDIALFIESCGWEVKEYFEEYIQRGLEGFFGPDTKKMN